MDAIDKCIEAAGFTFDVAEQKRLLRAASYGRVFCNEYPKTKFKDMCQSIRILNSVRDAHVGIPLTYLQYQALTPQVLVSRLANSHHHLLACRIAQYGGIGIERVLHHWSKIKILKGDGATDKDLCDAIVRKLQTCHGSSVASVASYAFQRNRKKLAAMLLEVSPISLSSPRGDISTDISSSMSFHLRRTSVRDPGEQAGPTFAGNR